MRKGRLSPLALAGIALVAVFALVALSADHLAPYDPAAIHLEDSLRTPDLEHWLGTDLNGSDILSLLIHGTRVSLGIALLTVVISMTAGAVVGAAAGYFGGAVDLALMRLVDVLMAFPGILLAIALIAALGPGVGNVVFALSALGWVSYARLVRSQVISLKEQDAVLAVRALGAGHARIIFRHLLPNTLPSLLVQATFSVAGVILSESALSFLGVGAPVGTPSWGRMLDQGVQVLIEAPHVAVFPGLAIMVMVLSFNFVGDGLRDWMDPRLYRAHAAGRL